MAQPARVINMDDHRGSGPQLENGYVRIANELYDEILRFKFTFRQLKVVFAVIRKTYGYGKKSDDISASQIGATCAMPRPHVASTLVELEQMGVLNRERGKFGTVTSINKNYKEWRSLKKREMEKVNEGFGGAVSRKPEDRLNHYVYRLDHDESGTFYIGVRSCDCLPAQDRYKGSGSWTATVRVSEIRKTILSTHDSRAEAEDEEKRVIREMSCVKGMRNRRRYVKGTEDELVQNLNTTSTESVHDIVRNLNSSAVQNRDTQKTTFQKTTPKDNPKRQERKPAAQDLPPVPEWVPADQWADFIEHRKLRKAPMTPLAAKRMFDRLAKLRDDGFCPAKLLDAAIRNGWQDVYPRDDAKVGITASAPKPAPAGRLPAAENFASKDYGTGGLI